MTMKLPCSVVRDLLPLYAENMTETETRTLVDEHLAECPECREKLSGIETGAEAPVDTAKPLASLKKQIRRRRWFAALVAGLLVFICVFTYFYHVDEWVLVPWEDGLIQVRGIETRPMDEETADEDGTILEHREVMQEMLILEIDSRLNGYSESTFMDEDGTRTLILEEWSTNSDLPFTGAGTDRDYTEQEFFPVPDRVIYSAEGESHLLYGKPLDGGVEILPRLALTVYLWIAAGLTAVLGLLWFLFRAREWSWISRQLFFGPASYVIAHFMIKGTHSVSFFPEHDLCSILLLTFCLYALFTLAWQIWLHRKATV